MRIQKILAVAAMLILCTAVAYADVRISSVITEEVIETGNAELVGDVQLTVREQPSVGGPDGYDLISIRYGLPITSDQISGTGTWACDIEEVDYEQGLITLRCPEGAAINTYYRLMGVRLLITGFTGNDIYAEMGTLWNAIWAGMDQTKIVRSIGPGLTFGKCTPATYMADGTAIGASGKTTLTEGFASAWKTQDQAGAGATNGVEICLELGDLPEDMAIYVDAASGTSSSLSINWPDGHYFDEDNDEICITFSATDPSEIEKLVLTFSLESTPDDLMEAGSYILRGTLSPNQDGLDGDEPFDIDDAYYPKFEVEMLPTAGCSTVTIIPNTTNLLIPFVTSENGLSTAIAIANTTEDPFDKYGAIPQDGYVTVTFYSNDADDDPITYSSKDDDVKGNGLASSGLLKSGSTWTVFAHELLAEAGHTGPFSGYAVIVTEFTNAHGASYISNWSGFTSSTPVLVLDIPAMYDRVPEYGTEWTTR